MMNLRVTRHHKICGLRFVRREGLERADRSLLTSGEGGYTLVALLALMTLLALFATAAAPSIRQQAQRERERESIFRGEQVAEAVRDYYIYRSTTGRGVGEQSLPTSIEDLLEGVPVPGGSKKRQILRPSAARDSLSTSAEWRLVRPRSPALIDFQRSLMIYAGGIMPQPQYPQMAQLQQFAAPQIANVLNTGSETPSETEADASADSSGPFVGVSSRSQGNSVLHYYGIERHDHWVFTPLFR
jgi:type II secretory pathway pseudopilin PulG